jgi:hypothetical protein
VTVFADVCVSTTVVVEQVSLLGPKNTEQHSLFGVFSFSSSL